MQNLGSIAEKAIDWVEGISYTVEVKGMRKLPYMTTKLALNEDSEQTVVLAETELQGIDSDLENIGPRIKGIMQITLQGLKEYVETGRKMPA